MKNIVLVIVFILALLVGFGTVIFYNMQDYKYTLELKNNIPTSEIYVSLSLPTDGTQIVKQIFENDLNPGINWSNQNIQYVSMLLGEMKFENNGALSHIIKIPRLIACFDLSATSVENINQPYNVALWPVYTTYKPTFNSSLGNFFPPRPGGYYSNTGAVDELYPQYYYESNNEKLVELKTGSELNYYISLRDSYLPVSGTSSKVFKNGKIEIYEVPTKDYNPISPEVTYDSLVYNPTCGALALEFDPVETIEII